MTSTDLKSLTLTSSWGMVVDLSSSSVERKGWEMRSPNNFNADIAQEGATVSEMEIRILTREAGSGVMEGGEGYHTIHQLL